ncbi:MAG: SIMPL domain-containing protein [Thermodesulfovibrio sp.]|nr:SIMPL domain-containing protein [Thermodesulfovibrio sp.]
MKTITLSVLFLIFILGLIPVYAEEKDLDIVRISITLEERKEITPDILNITLGINANAQRESEVINILGAIDKAIRALNLNYSGGSYSVYKNCWWEKDKRKCSGYKGELGYSFELKDAKEQNKILETIDEFKEKYGERMNYTVSNPQWLVSEKKAKAMENEIRLDIIDTALNFAKKAGEKLGKKCSISTINYDVRRPYFWEPPIFYKAAPMMEKAMIEAPEPKKEDKAINVKASVGFVCR